MISTKTLLGLHDDMPISSIGFIEAPYDTALEELNIWMLNLGKKFSTIDTDTATENTFYQLLPITDPWNKELLVSLNNGWTMYINNGNDPFPFSYIARKLNCRYIIAVSSPMNELRDASTQFQLFGPNGEPPLYYIRTIAAHCEDGKWRWYADGSVQNYEKVDSYKNNSIQNRFDNEVLLHYLASYDLYPADISTFANAALIEYKNR